MGFFKTPFGSAFFNKDPMKVGDVIQFAFQIKKLPLELCLTTTMEKAFLKNYYLTQLAILLHLGTGKIIFRTTKRINGSQLSRSEIDGLCLLRCINSTTCINYAKKNRTY